MLRENVILAGGVLEVHFESEKRYRLKYGDLVEYSNGERWVNGKRLEDALLKTGDEIRVGAARLVYKVDYTSDVGVS